MTAYEALSDINPLISISESYFNQLIKDFQSQFLAKNNYHSQLDFHRNPDEFKGEVLNELYSYLGRIQGRAEMRFIDLDSNSAGYVPTKVVEIWKMDRRLKSLYNSIQKYCETNSANFNITAVHIAEYRAIILLVRKIRRSLRKANETSSITVNEKQKNVRKTRVRIPKESKVRAELQKEIDSVCPFCSNTDVGHFEIHHIDDDPSNNNFINLILLCPTCHSKITKSDILLTEVQEIKKKLKTKSSFRKDKKEKVVNIRGNVSNVILGDGNVINVNAQKSKIIQKYPKGCIGFESAKGNYISYLIARYNEYKKFDPGKDKFNFAVFGSLLKKRFKIGPTRTIYNLSVERFDELVHYIKLKIDSTKLAKVKGRSHKNYETFGEYCTSQQNDN